MPDRRPSKSHEPRGPHLRVVNLHDPAGTVSEVEQAPERLRVAFDPIADLSRGTAAGYEVLLARPGENPAPPQAWSAEVHPQTAGRLEAGLVRRALAERERVPGNTFMLVNVSAAALASEEFEEALREAGRLERVVIGVGDDAQVEAAARVRRAIDVIREAGGTVAVDETGAGYA